MVSCVWHSTKEEIKSAYRREAMAWHPDKHQGADAKERAARNFRELQKAYQVLGNQVEREVYDGQ
jgi:DnaJ-class molecular chaperone